MKKEFPVPPLTIAAQITDNLQKAADHLLLQVHAPPAVVVNHVGDIVYISGHTGNNFWEFPINHQLLAHCVGSAAEIFYGEFFSQHNIAGIGQHFVGMTANKGKIEKGKKIAIHRHTFLLDENFVYCLNLKQFIK